MKKILSTLAIAAVFASCKKENVIAPVPAASKKLVKVESVDDAGDRETSKMTYDSKGRLLTYETATRINNFSYESDTRLVVASINKLDNTLARTYECTLNNKGAITVMLLKNPAGELVYSYEYTYDANNQMTGYKAMFPTRMDFEVVAEIVNGNITGTKLYRDGHLSTTTVYFYDGAKANKLHGALANHWPSAVLFGKPKPFLMTESKTFETSGTLDWHTKTSYELDSDGYVSKATTFYPLDGTTNQTIYQYQ